jgi:SynChlorMet cassette protein ScmD
VNNDEKPIANPFVVLREEFDDWAVLFDPDSGNAFGLSPTGVYLWKLLDGKHSIDDLLEDMRHHADNVPERISEDVGAFVDALAAQGLAGFDITEFGLGSGPKKSSSSPSGALGEVKQFNYERPSLVNLNAEASASGATCSSHGSAGGSCTSGGTATDCCYATGACAGTTVDSCCYAVLVSPGLVTAATGPALRRVKLAMAGVSRGRVLAPFAGLVPVPLRPAQPVLVFDS